MLHEFIRIIAKGLKKGRLSSISNSCVHPTSKIESGSSFVTSTMGRYSFCGYDCDIFHATIGSFTSIANQVVIGGANHPMGWASMSPVFYAGRDSVKKKFSKHYLDMTPETIIGNDVWIGRSAIILSGVNVGNGAVVGAGSIVTKNVPAYAVVVGNPARIIRYRFDVNTINCLESAKWWELEDGDLSSIAFCVKDPIKFTLAVEDLRSQKDNIFKKIL
jgi:acetyltransferase-like isoleucine patch superfamily enzyme